MNEGNEESGSFFDGTSLVTVSTNTQSQEVELQRHQSHQQQNNAPHTQRPVRRQFNKKSTSKRRKSLPPQNSCDVEHQLVTLIPRGPLICSNNEGLETHFFSKDQFFGNTYNKADKPHLSMTGVQKHQESMT